MTAPAAPLQRIQRTRGEVRLRFSRHGDGTRLAHLYQDGAGRVRLPRGRERGTPEAVLINTSGGLTSGDIFTTEVELDAGAEAWVTTQACEKLYRAADGPELEPVALDGRLVVGAGARLAWVPQPVILFDGGRFRRRLEIDLAEDASLLLVEATIFGRRAMGETLTRGLAIEDWRIRRGSELVFANAFRLDPGAGDGLAHGAALAGAEAMASVLLIEPDVAERLADFRERLDLVHGDAGASFRRGVLHAQLLMPSADHLMDDLRVLLEGVSGRALPRVWTC